jgi:SAM-dependent methyltransferase
MKKNEAEFDQYRDTYSEQINHHLAFSGQPHDFFTQVKADYLSQIFSEKQFFNEEINALDVGCGHGLIHPYLLEKNENRLRLSGVDVASTVIDIAAANNPEVDYKSYDGVSLPYEDNTFDVVFAICVMHHVPPLQWNQFIEEMKRVVKINGLLIIFEHNPINPITQKIVKNCPLDKDAVLIKSQKMKNLMQQAGLTVIKRNFILFTPFSNSFFRKLDRKLSWFPLGAQYYTLSRKLK